MREPAGAYGDPALSAFDLEFSDGERRLRARLGDGAGAEGRGALFVPVGSSYGREEEGGEDRRPGAAAGARVLPCRCRRCSRSNRTTPGRPPAGCGGNEPRGSSAAALARVIAALIALCDHLWQKVIDRFARLLGGSISSATAAACLATAALTVTALTGLASTAAAETDAPYAQATASVATDGTVVHSKNVTSVSRKSTGVHCVQVDGRINLSNVAIHVTPGGWRFVSAATPSALCGNAADSIAVAFANNSGTATDSAFFLSILQR